MWNISLNAMFHLRLRDVLQVALEVANLMFHMVARRYGIGSMNVAQVLHTFYTSCTKLKKLEHGLHSTLQIYAQC